MAVERVNSIIEYSMNLKRRNIQYSIRGAQPTSSKRNRTNYSESQARQKASYLASKFNNPNGINFYLKCAWNLSDQYLDWLLDYSFKKSDPGRYFTAVANKKMVENS